MKTARKSGCFLPTWQGATACFLSEIKMTREQTFAFYPEKQKYQQNETKTKAETEKRSEMHKGKRPFSFFLFLPILFSRALRARRFGIVFVRDTCVQIGADAHSLSGDSGFVRDTCAEVVFNPPSAYGVFARILHKALCRQERDTLCPPQCPSNIPVVRTIRRPPSFRKPIR